MRMLGVNAHLPTRQQVSPTQTLGFRGAIPVDQHAEWPTQTFQIPNWAGWTDGKKLGTLRKMAEYHGRDPRLRDFVINTVITNVPARDYRGQGAAILAWVQTNVRYVNESNEQLQTPSYTLRVKHGDCDDMAILIGAMAHSIALPFRYMLAGKDAWGRQVRWMEGTRQNFRARYFHIYPAIGIKGPFASPRDQVWMPAEPTMKGVPLGWDSVAVANGMAAQARRNGGSARSMLPELGAFGATGVEAILPVMLPVPAAPAATTMQIAAHLQMEPAKNFLHQIFGQDLVISVIRLVITTMLANALVKAVTYSSR